MLDLWGRAGWGQSFQDVLSTAELRLAISSEAEAVLSDLCEAYASWPRYEASSDPMGLSIVAATIARRLGMRSSVLTPYSAEQATLIRGPRAA